MDKLWNYHCSKHGVFEAWGKNGEAAACPECGFRCKQAPGSKGIKLEGAKFGFPRANRMWTERHERQEEPGREI